MSKQRASQGRRGLRFERVEERRYLAADAAFLELGSGPEETEEPPAVVAVQEPAGRGEPGLLKSFIEPDSQQDEPLTPWEKYCLQVGSFEGLSDSLNESEERQQTEWELVDRVHEEALENEARDRSGEPIHEYIEFVFHT